MSRLITAIAVYAVVTYARLRHAIDLGPTSDILAAAYAWKDYTVQ